ncbi:Cysteine synthase A [Serratia rubidaea]|uniref:cysteine synthase n=1 Tax=Serratia rubidaea TaxID=61652 RepID=A0A447QGH0_SERRU|nr:Cysteine synthase A [Serratia rubidaea]
MDVFISGVGTGGTLTGVSRYLKNTQGKAVTTVAVEPTDSPVISQALAGEELKPGPHKIQGIGAALSRATSIWTRLTAWCKSPMTKPLAWRAA